MFEIKDFQTLYNMVVASFIILTFSLLYDGYIKKGQVLDMIALFQFFNGARTVIITWLTMSCVFFCIVLVTKLALRTSRYVWIPVYILHSTINLSIAMYFARSEDLGFASIVIIMCESVRMLMKAHSYIRTKVLYLKDNPYRDF
jgi:sterol O-acyltransferase